MEKIPTAEEYLEKSPVSHFYIDAIDDMVCFSKDVQKAMISFAKLHVEAALKVANSKIEWDGQMGVIEGSNKILSAYPLENIK